MKKKAVYQIAQNTDTRTADITIYGNIDSSAELYRNWGMSEGEVSARDVKQAIDELDVDVINVYINSYGGEVAEAQVHTYCDGFACSASTIVFCAGDTRTMGSIALMMIHNCMSHLGYATSEEMRKAADDNDKINQSSIEAYKKVSNLSEDEIKAMMDKETWLTAQECLDYGFATEVCDDEDDDDDKTKQSAFGSIRAAVLESQHGDNQVLSKLDEIKRQLSDMQEGAGDPTHLDGQEQTGDRSILKSFFNNLI